MTRFLIPFMLLVASFALSRTIFWFINDPEGPNLLIVSVLALLIYLPTLAVYHIVRNRSKAGLK